MCVQAKQAKRRGQGKAAGSSAFGPCLAEADNQAAGAGDAGGGAAARRTSRIDLTAILNGDPAPAAPRASVACVADAGRCGPVVRSQWERRALVAEASRGPRRNGQVAQLHLSQCERGTKRSSGSDDTPLAAPRARLSNTAP